MPGFRKPFITCSIKKKFTHLIISLSLQKKHWSFLRSFRLVSFMDPKKER
jgi:hypothetical protein